MLLLIISPTTLNIAALGLHWSRGRGAPGLEWSSEGSHQSWIQVLLVLPTEVVDQGKLLTCFFSVKWGLCVGRSVSE